MRSSSGVFSRGVLSKLKFLETDTVTDDAIAAMGKSPDIVEIVFSYVSGSITNNGFQHLVDAVGAKAIVKVSAGTLKKYMSKTLTSKYMMAMLPKLVNLWDHQFGEHLSHMAQGKKKLAPHKAMLSKYTAQDSEPYAVIPPSAWRLRSSRSP